MNHTSPVPGLAVAEARPELIADAAGVLLDVADGASVVDMMDGATAMMKSGTVAGTGCAACVVVLRAGANATSSMAS